MIDVVQEKIERGDPLHEPALDQIPFARRDDPRDEVEGKNPLRSLVVVIDREGDALLQKGGRGEVAFALEIGRGHFAEARQQPAVMRSRHARRGKHFVEEMLDLVIGEKVGHLQSQSVSPREPRNEKRETRRRRTRARLRAGGAAFRRALAALLRRDENCAAIRSIPAAFALLGESARNRSSMLAAASACFRFICASAISRRRSSGSIAMAAKSRGPGGGRQASRLSRARIRRGECCTADPEPTRQHRPLRPPPLPRAGRTGAPPRAACPARRARRPARDSRLSPRRQRPLLGDLPGGAFCPNDDLERRGRRSISRLAKRSARLFSPNEFSQQRSSRSGARTPFNNHLFIFRRRARSAAWLPAGGRTQR